MLAGQVKKTTKKNRAISQNKKVLNCTQQDNITCVKIVLCDLHLLFPKSHNEKVIQVPHELCGQRYTVS